MRRNLQIVCIVAAAVVAGGTLWAVASSDMLGRFGLSSSTPAKDSSVERRSGDKIAAVSVPKAPGTGTAQGPAEALAIEIARIDAGGYSVIGGRSPPNHRIVVLANGREIASTVATDEGQWAVVVADGIPAGPLELSVSAKPLGGGPAVVSTPRQLVVPPSQAPTQVAEVPPARVWAPPMAAGTPASKASNTQGAGTPAQRSQGQGRVESQADSRTKSASDKQALETFAALVERARTDAATGTKGESPSAGAPSAGAPGVPSTPTTVTAASAAPAIPARPDPAQVPIPVPITFQTDEIELTTDGAHAASLLAEYLRLKRPDGISLSGHADARGPDGYNMELSKRRLEAIERYLRQAGYTGSLSLIPKGKREPYLGVDRTSLSLNEVYQADRRVELRLTQ